MVGNARKPLAVIIGISNYNEARLRLRTPARDAEQLATLLEAEHGYEIRLLRDDEATRERLVALFETELPALVDESRRVLVYFAGHGTAVDSIDDPHGYLVPADGGSAIESLLPMQVVSRALDGLACRHLLLVLDCCYAGAFRWAAGRDIVSSTLPEMYLERYQLFLETPAWQVITSAAYDEQAADVIAGMALGKRASGDGQLHSPFLEALVAGLKGEADFFPRTTSRPGDGVITATELYLYLRDQLETSGVGRQTPGIWLMPKHRKGEYIFHTPGRELSLLAAEPLGRETSPYRGLEVYEEKHASLFFGRSVAIASLRERVEERPITIIVGSSGTGKSSLVRAGLVPALRSAHPDWQILEAIRPGGTPLETLEAALATKTGQLAVLVIDQLEELFAPESVARRQPFLERVMSAIDSGVRVVGTLRADVETELWASPLAGSWDRIRFSLSDMTRDELREAIEIPAEKMVLTFDPPSTVERMINTVAAMPGALPLLSFTLQKLYLDCLARATGDRRLVEVNSVDVGGIATALRDHADSVYASFDDATRDTLKRVLLRMVVLKAGSVSRRQVAVDELDVDDDSERARIRRVVNSLTDSALDPTPGASPSIRIAVLGGDATGAFVELAHDAVARDWPRFKHWQDECQSDLVLHRAVTAAAHDWARRKRHAGFLWTNDPRLPLVRARLTADVQPVDLATRPLATSYQLDRVEAAFVACSRQVRRRRQLIAFGIPAVLIPLLVVVGVVAYVRTLAERVARANAEDNALAEQATQAGSLAQQSGREPDALAVAISASVNSLATKRAVPDAVAIGLAAAVMTPAHPLVVMSSTQTTSIKYVAMSHDGSVVVTGGAGGEVQLWNAGTGDLSATLADPGGGELDMVDLSRDAQRIATASKDHTAKVWTIATRKRVVLQHPAVVRDVRFSPNGSQVVTSCSDGIARVWDAGSGTLVATLVGHTAPTERVVFFPDGHRVVSTSDDGTARIWDIDTQKPVFTLVHAIRDSDPKHPITAVAVSSGGDVVITADAAGNVAVWSATTGALVRTLDGHRAIVRSAAIAPDGSHAVTASDDGSAIAWDLFGDDKRVLAAAGKVLTAAYSSNGARIVTSGSDNLARVWDAASGSMIAVLAGHQNWVAAAALSSDGRIIVTGSWDKSARTWSLTADVVPTTLRGHHGGVTAASFSPDGSRVATSSIDHTVKVWSASTGALVTTLTHDTPVRAIGFSRHGRRLMTASQTHVQIWDTSTWKSTVDRPVSSISDAALAGDGERFVVYGDKGTLIYNASGEHLTIDGDARLPTYVSFSSDGYQILTATVAGKLKIFDLAERSERGVDIPVPTGLFSARFSADGEYVVTSHLNHAAYVITKDLRTVRWILSGHSGSLADASFSADGSRIVTGGDDHTVRVWETARGSQLFAIGGVPNSVSSVSFSPDGTTILVSNMDGTAAIYPISMSALLPIACRLTRHLSETWPKVASACASYVH